MIRAVIIDDEADGIANLSFYLRKHEGILVMAAISDAAEAIQYINTHELDILFLDVHLKDRNGFELLQGLINPNFLLVFVTAYNQYAIQAFRANAIDYILKPIDEQELSRIIDKAGRHIQQFRQHRKSDTRNIPYIQLWEQGIPSRIDPQLILYIEALGSYSKLYFISGDSVTHKVFSRPIAHFEAIMDKRYFFRSHKSFLVNIHYCEKMVAGTLSRRIHLGHNCSVPVSRRRLKELQHALESLP